MDHKWSGDVDIGDCALQELYSKYIDQRAFIQNFGLGSRKESALISRDCEKLMIDINSDLTFIRESK